MPPPGDGAAPVTGASAREPRAAPAWYLRAHRRLADTSVASLLWLLVGALAVVAVLDGIQEARHWPVPVVGVLDEPAHLITAALLLAALPRTPAPRVVAWALVGSVAIDIDHIPLYLDYLPSTPGGGRPVTHSLITAAVLLAAAALARGPMRSALAGLSLGVCLHFVRDLGTGPGLPLVWPLSPVNVRIPYGWYFAVLVLAAAVVALRVRSRTAAGDR